MPQKRKFNFNLGKNWLFHLLRSGLRIIFLLVFLHWILWFTTYARGTSYFEAIKDESIDKHDKKTDKYNSKGFFREEHEEKNITEIEENILAQIEKKKGLNKNESSRLWKNQKLPNLEKLNDNISKLEKNNQGNKKELEEKKKEYQKELKAAKKETIENIQKELEKNELKITELDDNRNWWQRIAYDPLKFFLISPLNKVSKLSGFNIILEIIFKLLIIETLLILVSYTETKIVWENMEKAKNDAYLSEEEREKLNEETAPLIKYTFFNGFMIFLFNFCAFVHPAHFDRTNSWFQAGSSGANWYIWWIPLFISIFASNISTEFLRRGHFLSKQELKDYLVKNFIINLLLSLIMLFIIKQWMMNSKGGYLFSALGGLVRFVINTIRVKFFGHQEYFPGRNKKIY